MKSYAKRNNLFIDTSTRTVQLPKPLNKRTVQLITMSRRHQLNDYEVPEATEGLRLRLQQHLEAREDLAAALTCARALYRLTSHQTHRPKYPDWTKDEATWNQLQEGAATLR